MITVPKLLILLIIVAVIFGTKKLRNVGTDLGEAIRNFKTALKEGEEGGKLKEDTAIEGEANPQKTDDA